LINCLKCTVSWYFFHLLVHDYFNKLKKLATMTIYIYQIRDIVGVTFIFRMRYHKIYMINPIYSCLNSPLCDPHETSRVVKIPSDRKERSMLWKGGDGNGHWSAKICPWEGQSKLEFFAFVSHNLTD
jgi:hypothetical protein